MLLLRMDKCTFTRIGSSNVIPGRAESR